MRITLKDVSDEWYTYLWIKFQLGVKEFVDPSGVKWVLGCESGRYYYERVDDEADRQEEEQ